MLFYPSSTWKLATMDSAVASVLLSALSKPTSLFRMFNIFLRIILSFCSVIYKHSIKIKTPHLLVFYCFSIALMCTGGLKHHKCIILWFSRSQVWDWSHQAKMQVSTGLRLWGKPVPAHFLSLIK